MTFARKLLLALSVSLIAGSIPAYADDQLTKDKDIIKSCVKKAIKEVPPIPAYFDAYLDDKQIVQISPATRGNIHTRFAFQKCITESGEFVQTKPDTTKQ
jgi:hypothetical protein